MDVLKEDLKEDDEDGETKMDDFPLNGRDEE